VGSQYGKLKEYDIDFINRQHIFYIASSSGKEVNLSPKGYDSIYIIDTKTILYLDLPGSGNRTARDISDNGEITLVFNSFEESEAKILRIFAKGQVILKSDKIFSEYFKKFDVEEKYIRQFLIFNIYAVESSCGEAIPIMKFEKKRDSLFNWVKKMSKNNKLANYIEEHKTPPSLENLETQKD